MEIPLENVATTRKSAARGPVPSGPDPSLDWLFDRENLKRRSPPMHVVPTMLVLHDVFGY